MPSVKTAALMKTNSEDLLASCIFEIWKFIYFNLFTLSFRRKHCTLQIIYQYTAEEKVFIYERVVTE